MSTLDRDRWPALFPERSGKSREEIDQAMVGLAFTQHEDPRLHLRLLAPRRLRWRDPAEHRDVPGLLVSVVDREPTGIEIAVFVDDVPHEVSPAEWALYRLERGGHTLWASRQMDTPIGTMGDLLTRAGESADAPIARTNMAKDGQHIFTVTCQARPEEYEKWASMFCATLASFQLVQPERRPLAEDLASFMYLYPAIVGFSYPTSWALTEESLSDTECEVRLDHPEGGRATGTIHLSARADVRPGRMIAEHFAALERGGVHVATRPEPTACEAPMGFQEASVVLATGTQEGREVEIEARIFTAGTTATTLLLASCGPTRGARAVDWMVQRRAFQLARETLYSV